MQPPTQAQHHIRWMIRRDMFDVLDIEHRCFELPWQDDDFTRALRQRNSIGMVIERDERIVGYMIYELHKDRLHIINFAVDPDCRRQGVVQRMIGKLIGKLSEQRRRRILCEVRETNLQAQLFFRSMGFLAIAALTNFYDDTTEDAYQFEYLL